MARTVKQSELHRVVLKANVYDNDGRFLIMKRPDDETAFPGKWETPGGGLEVDDYVNEKPVDGKDGQWYYTLEKTLKREVKEETGLTIGKPEYLLDVTFIRPDGIPVVILSYFAKANLGEVLLDTDEHADYVWVTAEEAQKYDLIKGIDEEIMMVDRILKDRGK